MAEGVAAAEAGEMQGAVEVAQVLARLFAPAGPRVEVDRRRPLGNLQDKGPDH